LISLTYRILSLYMLPVSLAGNDCLGLGAVVLDY
jgi:hypothetical protein